MNRSLGVHISFVRSIAMDSWTDKQLALMKTGGNDKCNNFLKSKGIDPKMPVKPKYESDVAQLYKEVLKARVEGRPEPTSLPKPTPKKPYVPAPSSNGSHMSSGGGGASSTDANGMERMVGETDQQYIARQTRLRDEARARMAAKFGGGGMGGVGSSGGRPGGMAGIGSDPNYNPNAGYGGGGGVSDSVVNGLGNAFSFAASIVSDEKTKSTVSGLANSVTSAGAGFWGGLTSVVQDVAQGGGDDGLADLQRQFEAKKSTKGSVYDGFGSDNASRPAGSSSNFNSGGGGGGNMGGGGAGAAPAMPGEDPNGIERLAAETDQQYIARQTRLRDEAKARMAAKFGGGGMGGVGSGSGGGMGGMGSTPSAPSSMRSMPPAPSSGGAPKFATPQRSFTPPGSKTPPRKMSSDDFFSSFGN